MFRFFVVYKKKLAMVYFFSYIGTMSNKKKTKINRLLAEIPRGVVLLSSWLKEKGYSLDLLKRYRQSQWLESIGKGAMIRTSDEIDYYGALYALQKQANLKVHIGGRTALSLLGKAQYLEFSSIKAILFGAIGEKLPLWFCNYNWQIEIEYHSSSIFPSDLGLVNIQIKEFSVKVSGAARAMMECLYLAPKNQEILECYELMESMNNLRPQLIQELLEKCSSIKVKRLFLYLSERIGHDWFNYLDIQKIELGKGKRSIIKNGAYDPKYRITIPYDWKHHE